MKKEYIKYGLIIIIALVYGRLAINYLGLFDSEEEYLAEPTLDFANDTPKKARENYELKLSYNDPFLGKISQPRPKTSVFAPTPQPPIKTTNTPKEIEKLEITYIGFIQNNESLKKTGLLLINGKSYLITEGSTYEGVEILSFNKEECVYLYNGKKNMLKK